MKIKIMLLCALSALLLTGCQLAMPEKQSSSSDRLIGAFITSEYLDLFDMDGFLKDNLNSFSHGEIKVESNQAEYEGRLYASFNGTDNKDVSFGDVDGVPFFAAEFLNEKGEPYTTSYNGDGMVNSKFNTFYGDDEDKITLDGILYVLPDKNAQAQYINPVFQSADGKIYAKSGGGMSAQGEQSQGSVMSQKMEETVTVTENGKSKKKTSVINIAIETMLPPQKIIVVQMDKNNNAIKSDEYMPEKTPESITAQANAEYIIVETHKTDLDGKALVERKLYSKADTSVTTFFMGKSSIMTTNYTELAWEN